MKEFIFHWSIKNISYSWHKNRESIISPSFIAGPIQNSSWTLKLYPRRQNVSDNLGLCLRRGADTAPTNLSISFEFSCVSSENSLLHSCTFTEANIKNDEDFGSPNFLRYSEVFNMKKDLYLLRDTLRLRCRMWTDEGNVNEFGQSFGRTRFPIERISVAQKINFEESEEKTVTIRSETHNKSLIEIEVLHCKSFIKVEIKPKSVENIKLSFLELSFKDKMSRKIICEHEHSWFGAPEQDKWYLLLNTRDEYIVEHNVKLLCKFVYSSGEETKQIENEDPDKSRLSKYVSKYITSCTPNGYMSECPRISQDLHNLYVEQTLCDVELKTSTSSFFAHKFVLCARSPVLLAVLSCDMKEKTSHFIEIEDILDDILVKFLVFLYTDVFEDIGWDAAIGLYSASEKYLVNRLKFLSSSFLLKNVDVDNVCELLQLAERYQDAYLIPKVKNFILQNYKKIFSSSTWKQFAEKEPILAVKIMICRYNKEKGHVNATETADIKLSTLPSVQDDFTIAYHGGIFNDIVIKTRNATFHANRSVLGASSSVMREMLTKDLNDKQIDELEITDLEDDIVSRVLLFLYTDFLGDVEWDMAVKLYQTALEYQINRLKIKCSCFLLENIKIINASDLLLLSHEYCDDKLKSVVEDYILVHDIEIFGSNKWADFSTSNLLLANETMRLKYQKKE